MAHNLLTRRRLIGAVGLGMAGIVSGPLRAAVKPAFRWQDEAAGAAAPIAAACVTGGLKTSAGIGTFPSFLQENARFGHVFDTMTLKTG